MDEQALLEALVVAARAAGAEILKLVAAGFEVEVKSDQSPVTVNLTGETRKGVLTVPVNALLALPGGGFGLQVVRGGTTREVKVELGMFAEGRVEVSGGGLREGMKVGVPKI